MYSTVSLSFLGCQDNVNLTCPMFPEQHLTAAEIQRKAAVEHGSASNEASEPSNLRHGVFVA